MLLKTASIVRKRVDNSDFRYSQKIRIVLSKPYFVATEINTCEPEQGDNKADLNFDHVAI